MKGDPSLIIVLTVAHRFRYANAVDLALVDSGRGEFGRANGDFLEALNAPQIAFGYPERIGGVNTMHNLR
jgi:hypothetical protein